MSATAGAVTATARINAAGQVTAVGLCWITCWWAVSAGARSKVSEVKDSRSGCRVPVS